MNLAWRAGSPLATLSLRPSDHVHHPDSGKVHHAVASEPWPFAKPRCIPTIRQKEVDRLPGRIHSSVKEAISSFDVAIRLIPPPAPVCWLQMGSATLVQLRTVELNPSTDATGIDRKSALARHLRHMGERNWVPGTTSRTT
jgi:hypothetical protein